MLPSHSPKRVVRAYESLAPIFEFLGQYDKWLADADDSHCDFALGNPQTMPQEEFVSTLQDAAIPQSKDWFAYKMSEPGSRAIVRKSLELLTERAYAAEDIFLTNGATGALLVAMNALIETGDEVIYSNPPWFFYEGMILNSGGVPVAISVDPSTYDIDLDAIDSAITARTRLVIVNSPHNPTGKVYSADTLRQLASILGSASHRFGQRIYLVSDEAYRTVVYDGLEFVSPTNFYRNSIMIYTYGKTLLTPGQRIGYIALSPEIEEREQLRTLIASSQILCGWAMSSALMQHGLSRLQTLTVDVADLQRRRDRLVTGLRECGYEVNSPEGAFYVLPKTPIENDAQFVETLSQHGVFCLPGHIVKMPGHLRMSVTASEEMIERALPIMAAVREGLGT